MARDYSSKQGNLRERIAHLAARIIAEDGVDDFGYAKRKAARQAGAMDARAMPDNEQVERALAEYRQIYQADTHEAVLSVLRRKALAIMRLLAQFNPHLTGSVLSGVAGEYSAIELQLFAESPKEVEIYLLNEGVPFHPANARVYVNNDEQLVPTYVFPFDGTDVKVTLLDLEDLKRSVRKGVQGRTVDRASLAAVEAMVNAG
jgi:hypothetical protein